MNPHLSQLIRALLRGVGLTTVHHCVQGRKFRVPLECTSLRHLLHTTDVPHEGPFYQKVLAMVGPGDVVFDIGAHLGKYVVGLADRVAPHGRVIAFEANPTTARHLQEIVRLNGLSRIVTVVNTAIGETTGSIVMKLHGAGCDAGQSLLEAGSGEAVEVPITTVDSYVAASGLVPKTIKIDVEGYELKVLDGARHTLATQAPSVCCEIHPQQLAKLNRTPADVEHFLDQIGYLAQPGTAHSHRPNDPARPYDLIFRKKDSVAADRLAA